MSSWSRWRDGLWYSEPATDQRGWIPGRRLLAAWLAVLGFSLYPLLVHGTADVGALVGWMRLVATFALVWFVPYAVYRIARHRVPTRSRSHSSRPQRSSEHSSRRAATGHLGARLSGANDPNSTGLLAAIVIVLALHGPVTYLIVTQGADVCDRRRRAPDDPFTRSTTAAVLALGVLWSPNR